MCNRTTVLECVINVSEGRRADVLADLARAAGPSLLDLHADADHHRSVLTMAGPADVLRDGVRNLATAAVAELNITDHRGAHPRIGVLDVVPWVPLIGWPLRPGSLSVAIDARDQFARWAGETLALPCFLYGPERSLPDVRRRAWISALPDEGPPKPHPTAGAGAVGARPVLVAYNLWLASSDLALARAIAAQLRSPAVRALGLTVGDGVQVQVSCNLIDPWQVGPEAVFDAVASRSEVAKAELVGLIPGVLLDAVPEHRWPELDLDRSRTVEARLEELGLNRES
jgi:glutamate formiminotransferase / 5-formyltetrahydrofolate cyclo-ligase